MCLFTGLTKVEMCTDRDGLQLRFPGFSKGRAHKIDIKKTDLQTQAKAFGRANPSFTFCSLAPLRKTRKAPNSVRLPVAHISIFCQELKRHILYQQACGSYRLSRRPGPRGVDCGAGRITVVGVIHLAKMNPKERPWGSKNNSAQGLEYGL